MAALVAGDRPGDYRFSHALVRSAVVAQLCAADQRRWHVAADAIEHLYQGQLRPHLAELAHHRVAGSLPGDRMRASRALSVGAGEIPGWQETLTGLARRAERRGDHVLMAWSGLEMDPIGITGGDSGIGRICERALAGPGLDGPQRPGRRGSVPALSPPGTSACNQRTPGKSRLSAENNALTFALFFPNSMT